MTKKTITRAARAADQPNKPKLNIHVQSVQGSGGTGLQFTAKVTAGNGNVLAASKQFGRDAGASRRGLLYEGDHVAGPYTITITAEEHPTSDDRFTEGSITLSPTGNTLEASGSTQIKNAPGDDDERNPANYTITCVADITPAVEITGDVDLINTQVNFEVMPQIAQGKIKVFFFAAGGRTAIVANGTAVSGGQQNVRFQWTTGFPQGAGAEFKAESVHVELTVGNKKPVEDVRAVVFTGYGIFEITSFGLPDDDLWTGATEQVALNEEGTPPYRTVHKDWIHRVRSQEARGRSQGTVYEIVDLHKEDIPKQPKGITQRLIATAEAGCANVSMAPNLSLAKQRSDRRFRCRNKILLSTDPGTVFAIHDTGNFKTLNRFDRYIGLITPSTPNVSFPSAYVVKIP
jgi:hypothetical protein